MKALLLLLVLGTTNSFADTKPVEFRVSVIKTHRQEAGNPYQNLVIEANNHCPSGKAKMVSELMEGDLGNPQGDVEITAFFICLP